MEKPVAQEISLLMLEISKQLDASVRTVMDTCEQREFEQYRLAVGKLMGGIFVDILTPIFKQYPDLTPEGLKHK